MGASFARTDGRTGRLLLRDGLLFPYARRPGLVPDVLAPAPCGLTDGLPVAVMLTPSTFESAAATLRAVHIHSVGWAARDLRLEIGPTIGGNCVIHGAGNLRDYMSLRI